MKYQRLIIAALFYALLMIAGISLAQQTTHQHGSVPKNSNPPNSSSTMAVIPVSPTEALKSADEAAREIENAVEQNDGRLLAESVKRYLTAMESIETYFDNSSPQERNFEKDITRAEKALDRQIILLGRLSVQSNPEFQKNLKSVLDASQRARDGLTVVGSGDSKDGHHRNGGHHGKGGLFGRRCMN